MCKEILDLHAGQQKLGGPEMNLSGAYAQGKSQSGASSKTARDQHVKSQKNLDHFSICACHPCAGAMLIFSVSFQFYRMSPKRQYGSHSSAYKLAFGSFAGRFGTKSRVGRSFPSPQAIVLMPFQTISRFMRVIVQRGPAIMGNSKVGFVFALGKIAGPFAL